MNTNEKKLLLSKLEDIIGNSCWNGLVGLDIRYPIRFSEKGKDKDKCWSVDPKMSLRCMRTEKWTPFFGQLA